MSPLGEFALDRTGWTPTASSGNAALAIDGDDSTRWTTNAAQSGSEWISIDLSAVTRFNRVSFNHTNFAAGDYPRNFYVEVSSNGSSWTTVYTGTGSSSSKVTTASFTPTTARFVRINQTGSAGDYWSVGELNIFNDAAAFNRTQWTATASGGTAASALIDGDVNNRWTSNAAQAAGQWVQLNLGARMTINNVTLDSQKNNATEGDYPRGYTVQVSNNGTAWTQVASGAGTFKATNISFVPVSAQYVRVNQTGTAAQWWSIGRDERRSERRRLQPAARSQRALRGIRCSVHPRRPRKHVDHYRGLRQHRRARPELRAPPHRMEHNPQHRWHLQIQRLDQDRLDHRPAQPARRVLRSHSDNFAQKAPKTARGRRILPLVDRALEIARAWASGKGPDDYLATGATGLQLRGTYFRRALHWTTMARGFTIHALRHYAASTWLRQGIPINQVAAWLGDDPRTVLKVYAHVLGEEQDREALRRLNSLPSHSPDGVPGNENRGEGGGKGPEKTGSDQGKTGGDGGI